jgi:hypothetical protein
MSLVIWTVNDLLEWSNSGSLRRAVLHKRDEKYIQHIGPSAWKEDTTLEK